MAYSETVAERIRAVFKQQGTVVEKKMFGGLAFIVDGHMCCGILGDRLMARVGPDQYAQALAKPHVSEMDFTGKPLKGFLYVEPAGFADEDDLEEWIDRCLRCVRLLPPKKAK